MCKDLQVRRRQLLKHRMQLQLGDQERMESHQNFKQIKKELVSARLALTVSKKAAKRLERPAVSDSQPTMSRFFLEDDDRLHALLDPTLSQQRCRERNEYLTGLGRGDDLAASMMLASRCKQHASMQLLGADQQAWLLEHCKHEVLHSTPAAGLPPILCNASKVGGSPHANQPGQLQAKGCWLLALCLHTGAPGDEVRTSTKERVLLHICPQLDTDGWPRLDGAGQPLPHRLQMCAAFLNLPEHSKLQLRQFERPVWTEGLRRGANAQDAHDHGYMKFIKAATFAQSVASLHELSWRSYGQYCASNGIFDHAL